VDAEAERLIERYVRPLVEADGGRIELVSISRGKVVVKLSGTCAGCPGQPYTLEHVIEPVLRRGLGAHLEIEVRS
jgi:Fe-S cluster biogenesis protein NfuA